MRRATVTHGVLGEVRRKINVRIGKEERRKLMLWS